MFTHTSTEWAPWFVIPADRKWFARVAAAAVIAHALIQIDPQYPTPAAAAARALQEAKLQLEAEAPAGALRDPFEQQEEDLHTQVEDGSRDPVHIPASDEEA